jgi:hypothetical protein
MPRFILTASVAGAPPGYVYQVFPRGTAIASDAASAVPPNSLGLGADIVWPQLCAAPTLNNMAPLDAAAAALMPGVPITTLSQLAITPAPTGVET